MNIDRACLVPSSLGGRDTTGGRHLVTEAMWSAQQSLPCLWMVHWVLIVLCLLGDSACLYLAIQTQKSVLIAKLFGQ